MDKNRWDEIERVFSAALERPANERLAYVIEATDDDEIRAELRAMLDITNDGRELHIEEKFLADAGQPMSATQRVGQIVGQYELAELLGRGGMGDVYLAKRVGGDVEHEVAVKLLRTAMVTDETVARFRTERRILSRLAHPDIVGFIDAGMTAEGQPYLVMPVIRGLPVTEYCDRHELDVPSRLALFRRVCEAVQFAHQNLVVHRDIKPTNTLVTNEGDVRLLDFGIAKIVDDEDATTSAMTRTGASVMTPEYAAPEQVRGEPVTTAVDVYGLGLLLYELLSGKNPQRRETTSRAELERVVLELTPEPLAEAVTDHTRVANFRAASRRELSRELTGDLQTIVDMALRKEPERRYRTAGMLGDDIDRYLRGMPVKARPDTAGYRLRKFVGRNRIAVAASALAVLALFATTGIAVREGEKARVERDRARQVTTTLVEFIGEANPAWHPGADTLRVREFLMRNQDRVIAELEPDPAVQGDLAYIYANVYLHNREYEAADSLLWVSYEARRKAYGDDHDLTVRLYYSLAVMAYQSGKPNATDLVKSSHDQVVKSLYDDIVVATSFRYRSYVADTWEETASYLDQGLERRAAVCADSACVGRGYFDRASAWEVQGMLDAALADVDAALRLYDMDPNVDNRTLQRARTTRASVLLDLGDIAASTEALNEVLATEAERGTPNDIHVGLATASLGRVERHRGRLAESVSHYERALSILEAREGSRAQRYAGALAGLATTHLVCGRPTQALETAERGLDLCPRRYYHTITSLRRAQAGAWLALGNAAEAADSLEAWVPPTLEGKRNYIRWSSLTMLLAKARLATGEVEGARTLFDELAAYYEDRGASREVRLAEARAGAAACAVLSGDAAAERALERELAVLALSPIVTPDFLAALRSILARS